MFIINHKKIFISVSVILMLVSIACLVIFGLNFSIDFTGGSILEVEYSAERPEISLIKDSLNLEGAVIQPAGERGVLIRTKELSEEEHRSVLASFPDHEMLTEKRFSSIGPALGQELLRKGVIAVFLVIILIILFIAFVFRGTSREVSSWKYGAIAVFALAHDVLIPTGVVSVLGHFRGFEIDGLFLTAILTILGLSVNDTIVVFDRIRENLKKNTGGHFDDIVGKSLNETLVRSINTSLTIIVVLLAIFFFGGDSTKGFALVMAIGMFVGTYSSIFLAAPLLSVFKGNKA